MKGRSALRAYSAKKQPNKKNEMLKRNQSYDGKGVQGTKKNTYTRNWWKPEQKENTTTLLKEKTTFLRLA